MARVSTPKSAYALINAIYKQATGEQNLTAVDTSSFVAMGEALMASGKENVMNAISYVVGKTKIDIRAYKGKFQKITMEGDVFDSVTRKISFYTRDALDTTMFNTDTNANRVVEGAQPTFTSLRLAMPLEEYYTGHSTWMTKITRTSDQLKEAFRSESDFTAFMGGIMTEVGNEIELQKEAFRRAAVLNYIAEGIEGESSNGTAINMTTAYNTEFGTSYTTAQLKTTYRREFAKFFMAKMDELSEQMTNLSTLYHDCKNKTVNGVSYNILRHTPTEDQRVMVIGKLKRDIEFYTRPDTFHDGIFDMDSKCEIVEYWQDVKNPLKISCKPCKVVNGVITAADAAVTQDNILALIYDKDALGVQERFSKSDVEHNAEKQTDTTLYFFDQNLVNDVTKQHIVLYMADPVTP